MKQKDQHIEGRLPLYFEGRLTDEQASEVEAWIDASADNKAIAGDMADIYRSSDALFIMTNTDDDEAYSKVNRKIKQQGRSEVLRKIEKIAAVLFIPLFFVTVLQLYFNLRPESVPMVSYATSPGMTAKVALPDGTEVTLNSGSRITYPEKFTGKTRNVAISGEAYFAVAKDSKHIFEVSTPCQAKVKVYGTHFNIDASEAKEVVATLEEGSVAMSYLSENGKWAERKIEPGQQITYSPEGKTVRVGNADIDVVTSWKDGKLVFHNTPVRDVLRMLSKRYGVTFDVRNPRVYNSSFTGSMTRQRLDRVLEIISFSSNIEFSHVANGDASNEQETIEVY